MKNLLPLTLSFWLCALVPGFSQEILEADPVVAVATRSSVLFDYAATTSPIPGDTLYKEGVSDLEDLTFLAPNVFASDAGTVGYGDVYSVRGLSNTPFFSDPALSFYVDGVPYFDASTFVGGLDNASFARVWTGPQTTRFGAGAYGGVVEIESERPGDTWGGRLSTEAGTYQLLGASGWVGGPLIPGTLFLQIGGQYEQRDGFLRNSALGIREGDRERGGVFGSLLWKAAPGWEAELQAGWDRWEDGAPELQSLASADFGLVASGTPGLMEREANRVSLRVAYEGEEWDFSTVLARRGWDLSPYLSDLDFSPLPFFSSGIEQEQIGWLSETRVSYRPGEEDFDLSGGLFLSSNATEGVGVTGIGLPTLFGIVPLEETTTFRIEEETIAFYGEAGYRPVEALRVFFGARVDLADKALNRSKTSPLLPFRIPDLATEQDFAEFSPKAGFTLEASEEWTVFSNFGVAHKLGGYSAFANSEALAEFDTERNWFVEFGVQGTLLDGRLRAGLTAYHYWVEDYQVERQFSATDYFIANAEEVSSLGAELQVDFTPFNQGNALDGLGFELSVGVNQTEFESYRDPVTGADLTGNRVPYAPAFDAYLGIRYQHPSGVFARVGLRGVGDTWYDDLETPLAEEPAYALVSAQVGFAQEAFEVVLFGENLTDEEYFTNRNVTLPGGVGSIGTPAMAGVRTTFTF
ncbi:MAG: TonB-dependent receptor plug domain-containing protein [Verrucomicrobiota bacterium]